jgi:hypothetical protein
MTMSAVAHAFADRACAIRRAEIGDELRLRSIGHLIEHDDVETALTSEQRCEQSDRTRTGDHDLGRLPLCAGADASDVLPCLGDHARRFQQHTDAIESGIDLDRVFGADPVPIGRVAVPSVNAALGIAAIAAHVPLTDRAVRTRDPIGSAHDADDQIAARQAAVSGRVEDTSE